MSLFAPHSRDSAPEESRPLLDGVMEKTGSVPNVLAVLAKSPTALRGYLSLSGPLQESIFTEDEQQFILLAISVANGCHYCVPVHTVKGARFGLAPEVIEALREERAIPDARLAALNTFIRQIVLMKGWVTENEVDDFLAAGFTKRHVMDVILGAALKTISNYANHIAATPLDKELEPARWDAP